MCAYIFFYGCDRRRQHTYVACGGPCTGVLGSYDSIKSGPDVWENNPPHTLAWTLRLELPARSA